MDLTEVFWDIFFQNFFKGCVSFDFWHLLHTKVSSLCKALIYLTFLRIEKIPKKMRQVEALFCCMLLGQSEMISLLAEPELNRCMRVTAYLQEQSKQGNQAGSLKCALAGCVVFISLYLYFKGVRLMNIFLIYLFRNVFKWSNQ